MGRQHFALPVFLAVLLSFEAVLAAPVSIGGKFSEDRVSWGDEICAIFGLRNNTSKKQDCDVWGKFTYQGSTMAEFGPKSLRIPANFFKKMTECENIPVLTPFGEYCLEVHVGSYPVKWETASDCFTVTLFGSDSREVVWEKEEFSEEIRKFFENIFIEIAE